MGIHAWKYGITDCIHRLFKNLGFFSQNSPGMIEVKKQLLSQKGIVLKICFLSFHSPSTSISKYYLADMHNSLIWLVWNFLLMLSFGSREKKLELQIGIVWLPCIFCVLVDINNHQKWEFHIHKYRQRKVLRPWSESVHPYVRIVHSLCEWNRRMKQQQNYKGIMLFIGSLKKDTGEWLFWVVNKAQWPFSFNWWNPSALICCFISHEWKISKQTSSFGPEVLILIFSNFFVKLPYPQFA